MTGHHALSLATWLILAVPMPLIVVLAVLSYAIGRVHRRREPR